MGIIELKLALPTDFAGFPGHHLPPLPPTRMSDDDVVDDDHYR
jgi:hypothetical protein